MAPVRTTISNKATGFSLIELMAAVALSLVLVAGVATVYITSKQTYNARDELSGMQENARAALSILKHHLEHAGYTTPSKLLLNKAFYVSADPAPASFNCGTMNPANPADLRKTIDNNSATGTGDSIGVVFFADQFLANDCNNVALPTSCLANNAPHTDYSKVYNTFYVATETGQAPTLYCASSSGTQALVEGVENMQFAYGVDQNNDGVVERYLDASGVDAAVAWSQVRTIKVALLMRSHDPVYATAEAQVYNLLGTDFSRNDRFQRTVHTTVIYLRNLAPI